MAQTKTAKYKRYNGTDWDTIHFESDASVVSPTTAKHYVTTNTKINDVAFVLDSSDGTKSTLTLYASSIAMSSTDATKVSAAISAIDGRLQTLESAYTGGGNGSILTSENYSTTLDSVYQAKDEDLAAIAALTGTSGLLKKTAANTWTLDTNSYVTQSAITTAIQALDGVITGSAGAGKTLTSFSQTDGKVTATFDNISITTSQVSDMPTSMKNPNALSFGSNSYDGSAAKTIRGDNTYIASGNTKTVKSYIDDKISNVTNIANGKTKTYILSYNETSLDKTNITYYNNGEELSSADLDEIESSFQCANSIFNSQNNEISLSDETTYIIVHTDYPVNNTVSREILTTSSLRTGDIINIIETDVPDRWATSVGYFYKMETAKVDLDPFAEKSTTVSSNDTSKGVKVTLGGTIGSTTVDVEVTGGSVANGNASVVDGGTVYNAIKDLAPKENPTFTGTITTGLTSGFVKSNANGVLSVDTNTYLTAHPTISTSADTTPSGTLSHGGTFTAVTGVTRDSNGHVTTIATKTYTLPGSGNTDTKTASTASTGTKLFLVGAAAQAATGQDTKSNVNCYVGTDNCLYSNANRVPTIFYADTVPTSGMVTGDICIEY